MWFKGVSLHVYLCAAVLIPIPTKGDLISCDKWYLFSGKVVARILQERMQKLDKLLCGFRKECRHDIFVRQLIEKSW